MERPHAGARGMQCAALSCSGGREATTVARCVSSGQSPSLAASGMAQQLRLRCRDEYECTEPLRNVASRDESFPWEDLSWGFHSFNGELRYSTGGGTISRVPLELASSRLVHAEALRYHDIYRSCTPRLRACQPGVCHVELEIKFYVSAHQLLRTTAQLVSMSLRETHSYSSGSTS